MAVLNTDVGNSDALGTVAMGRDTTGGAIVLPDADISPDKVLWYSLQREDQERKKSQAAARQALSELNDIRVNGWANHLTELNQQKNDLLTKASNYLQKYRGKSWSEFDPRNPQQSKEALDIQKQLSQLKEMEAFSEQVKQWHQADVNAYKGKETNFDPESITQNTDFYKKPLSEAYKDFSSTGERPMLEQAFPDWRTKAMSAAKSVGSQQQLTKREADGRIVTYGVQDVPDQENELAVQGFLHTDVGKQAVKDISKDHPDLNGDQIIDYFKSHYWDNFQNKKSRYENVASPTTRAFEKEQPQLKIYDFKGDKGLQSEADFPTLNFGDYDLVSKLQQKQGNLKNVADIVFKGGKSQKIEIPTGGDLYMVDDKNDLATIKSAGIDRTNFEPQRILNFDGRVMLEVTKTEPQTIKVNTGEKNTDGSDKIIYRQQGQESRYYIPVNQFVANKLKGVVGDEQWKQIEGWFKQPAVKTETKSAGTKTAQEMADDYLKTHGQ